MVGRRRHPQRAVGKINIEFRQDDAERLFNLMARDEFEMFLFRRDANPKITTAAATGAFFLPWPRALGEKQKMHRCRRRSVITRTLSCARGVRRLFAEVILFKFTRNFIVSERPCRPLIDVYLCARAF